MTVESETALSSPDGRRHVAALDGIRGLAILLVMFFHMTNLQMRTPIDSIWFGMASLGASGVNLFFVLSGYLITGILLDSKGQPHYFRNFYMRRVLRIFPLYYLVVFAALVVLPLLHVAALKGLGWQTIWYCLFLSNFSIAYHNTWQHQILDVTWSLSIEEQFYLIWPTIVLFCRRRTLLIVCATFMLIALLSRAVLILRGHGLIQIVTLTPCRLDGLAAGAAIAVMARGPTFKRLILPAAAMIPVMTAYLLWTHRGIAVWDNDRQAQIFGFSAEALLFASLLVFTLDRPFGTLASILKQRWLGLLGRFSYALYLVHLPLRAAVRDKVYSPSSYLRIADSPLPGQVIFYALAISLSLCVAAVSWYGYERHFLKLKRLFPMSRHLPALQNGLAVPA